LRAYNDAKEEKNMVLERVKAPIIAPHRILALSDVVYDVVITILDMELSVPVIIEIAVNKDRGGE
jgi:uncharacterized membrane protein